jgi:hypothetical protein
MVLLAASACAPFAASAATPGPMRARLRGFVCQHALDPPARAVSVQAVMRPVQGTTAMALKFDLLQRLKGSATFSDLHAGDLGTWVTPKQANLGQRAGDVWVLAHPVADLPAPADYRYKVAFRWTGAHGKVLATVTRTSGACFQPELRPDLLVSEIDIAPVADHPRQALYTATIQNAGGTPAGPFEITFTPADGSPAKSHTVQRLRPHGTRQEVFFGQVCTATYAPTIAVDPQHIVDDLDFTNNGLTVGPTCPAQTLR